MVWFIVIYWVSVSFRLLDSEHSNLTLLIFKTLSFFLFRRPRPRRSKTEKKIPESPVEDRRSKTENKIQRPGNVQKGNSFPEVKILIFWKRILNKFAYLGITSRFEFFGQNLKNYFSSVLKILLALGVSRAVTRLTDSLASHLSQCML